MRSRTRTIVVVVALAILMGAVAVGGCGTRSSDATTAAPTMADAGPQRTDAAQPHEAPGEDRLEETTQSQVVFSLYTEDALTVKAQAARSDIVLVGRIVEFLPARWNSVDGKAWYPDEEIALPTVYSTFLVEPQTIVKGTPRWGSPVAFRLPGGTPEVESGPPDLSPEIGQVVLLFGVDEQRYGPGAHYEPEAYWLTVGTGSVFVASGPGYARLRPMADPKENSVSLEAVRVLTSARE